MGQGVAIHDDGVVVGADGVHVGYDYEGCCCVCRSSCDDITDELAIAGYYDGDIPASECSDARDAFPTCWTWDGRFIRDYPGSCLWVMSPREYGQCTTIDGKMCYLSSYAMIASVQCVPGQGFIMYIYLEHSNGGPLLLWAGKRQSFFTPLGIYTRTDGCASGPTSLLIEEV